MSPPDRERIHQELLAAPAQFRELLDSARPQALGRRTDGTRWTNREMLFHLLIGYLVTRTLLPLVWLMSRLPKPIGRGFAATLNAAARPFHLVNYLGSVAGGHVLRLTAMQWLFDHTCAALARRLARSSDAALARWMPFPKRWDPFFTDHMTMLDVYHYPAQHFAFHRRQLTLSPDRTEAS